VRGRARISPLLLHLLPPYVQHAGFQKQLEVEGYKRLLESGVILEVPLYIKLLESSAVLVGVLCGDGGNDGCKMGVTND
jgi:hypothetical protein